MFGVLSFVFRAIVLVVAIKYVVFVMRADNEGEGGTMALLSLALPVAGPLQTGLLIVGLAGRPCSLATLSITPAISVLSAVEGLGIASPTVTPYVVPIAAVVLVCLFSIQSRGSGAVGFLISSSSRSVRPTNGPRRTAPRASVSRLSAKARTRATKSCVSCRR